MPQIGGFEPLGNHNARDRSPGTLAARLASGDFDVLASSRNDLGGAVVVEAFGVLLKIAYYGVNVLSALIVGFFFLANLFGSARPGDTWVHQVILIVSGLTAIALLVLAIRLGHVKQRWLAGLGVSVVAGIVFFVMMVGGALLFTKVNWQ
jgi:hypothetical protein